MQHSNKLKKLTTYILEGLTVHLHIQRTHTEILQPLSSTNYDCYYTFINIFPPQTSKSKAINY